MLTGALSEASSYEAKRCHGFGVTRMNIRYKIRRIFRWSKRIGLLNALNFELQQTLRRPIISFNHGGIDRRICIRSSSSDVSIFEHVFIEDEFDINLGNPKLIIDGGANCGLAALYFAIRYPGAVVLAVEPDSENCLLCAKNTAGLQVDLVKSAIWSRSTYLKIENPEAEPWAFRCIEAEEEEPGSFEARDMKSLLAGRHCDLLKLDIEGGENELFREPDWLDYVSAVVVEIHNAEADSLIRKACADWKISETGEKLLLVR